MPSQIENTRHSFAHLLAAAVKRLYPDVKFGIGPTIENGFYYDFDFSAYGGDADARGPGAELRRKTLSEKDLPKIASEMIKIAKEGHEFKKEEWDTNRAREHFAGEKQPYKLELNDELTRNPLLTKEGRGVVGMVYMGDAFLDLCRGGHVENTKDLPLDTFKLTRVAGAYWRGSEKNPMLTRVYGIAFATPKELEDYLKQMEEAEKRDHKKLGKELGLFTFSELVGPGLPLFTPKGTMIWNELQKFSESLKREAGYLNVHIPHITKPDLYKVSGHLEKFKNDIFYVSSSRNSPQGGKENELILKPMNCPHHTQIYASSMRSYKDLPVRFYETTTAYRDEQPGELGGLTRVRSITTDDSHCFAREDQIEQEFDALIKAVLKVVKKFALTNYKIRLSLRDEQNKNAYLGDDALWDKAQKQMGAILEKNKIKYETAEGEAAFYGPKMDFMINDSIGREWQISTIQLDLNMPARFMLEYIDKDGSKKTPVMIHSAFLGSIERFMGIIIEHYAGAFPLWLAPEQIWIVPVSEKFNEYAEEVAKQLPHLRVIVKSDNETLGKKIREGQLQKIPYLIIVGEKEEKSNKISVRDRKMGDLGLSTVKEFSKNVKIELY